MAWDLKFDPATRDTIPDGKGSVVRTETAETMVEHQLAIVFASWWGDRRIGTRQDLKSFGRKPEIAIPDEYRRSLRVVEARGRIADVQVIAERPNSGRVNVATRFRDVRVGRIVKTTTGG